jgi:hypothetical protein
MDARRVGQGALAAVRATSPARSDGIGRQRYDDLACREVVLVRMSGLGCIVAIVLAVPAGQKPEERPVPAPGNEDIVVVRGCVSGSVLRDLRARKTDASSGAETAAVYRLSGDKQLVQQMRKEHQNKVLDVTGRLPSEPNITSVARSKQVGKGRVFVGAGRQAVSEPTKPPSYPTLRVLSFEVVRPGCER